MYARHNPPKLAEARPPPPPSRRDTGTAGCAALLQPSSPSSRASQELTGHPTRYRKIMRASRPAAARDPGEVRGQREAAARRAPQEVRAGPLVAMHRCCFRVRQVHRSDVGWSLVRVCGGREGATCREHASKLCAHLEIPFFRPTGTATL
jgi:hypothetical protein